MPRPALPPRLTLLAHAAVFSVFLPASALGCALPPSARARALPQVFVTLRHTWNPNDLSVQGMASFPLRNVVVSSSAPVSDWVGDETYVRDLEVDVPLFDEQAWSEQGRVACRRADTCAWQRVRTVRALAAWGVAP